MNNSPSKEQAMAGWKGLQDILDGKYQPPKHTEDRLLEALVALLKTRGCGGHAVRAAEDHAIRLLVDEFMMDENDLRGIVDIGIGPNPNT
jgi:hypothetical protein